MQSHLRQCQPTLRGVVPAFCGREVSQILKLAGNFAHLSQETRDAMEYYILERPTRDIFDKKILRYRGLSVWMLKNRIRLTLPVLDGTAYALEVDSVVIPVVDELAFMVRTRSWRKRTGL